MSIPEYCSDQPFDANYLGGAVWRLNDVSRASNAVDAARADSVKLMVARGNAECLAAAGFRRIVTMLTYSLRIDEAPNCSIKNVRMAKGDRDAEAIAGIAGMSFCHDRYHADARIPKDAADRLKGDWARNDALGRASTFIAEGQDGYVAGFIAMLPPTKTRSAAVIDLIAVANQSRGLGIAGKLVDAASEWTYRQGSREIQAGTQATNEASRTFYEKHGFAVVDEEPVWHWMPE